MFRGWTTYSVRRGSELGTLSLEMRKVWGTSEQAFETYQVVTEKSEPDR